uniref:Protein RRNAD1 n=2 Tax=Zeugodacus cucurbitae TaxID=28588 RepID=A0A0A1X6Z8_ZEUCU
MALPEGFSSSLDYFKASLAFLRDHSWIYKNPNTRFIKAGMLESIPSDYINYFLQLRNSELNIFPFLYDNEDFNNGIDSIALQTFRSTLRCLIPKEVHDIKILPDQLEEFPKWRLRKMSVKKQHEIMRLTKIIQIHCHDIHLLIDFGAGLGYLSQTLCSINKSWRILGLEANVCRVMGARKRLEQQIPESSERVTYVEQYIEPNTDSAIKYHVSRSGLGGTTKWAIIGLHTCADLSVTSIKLFFEISEVKRLVIMPCCYHKLSQTANGHFLNFPLSNALKSAVAEAGINMLSYFNRPFLRLACQETSARWRHCSEEEHAAHGEQMFWRAVAEAIIDDETEIIATIPKSQRPNKCWSEMKSFSIFRQVYKVRSKTADVQFLVGDMWNNEHKDKFNKIVEKYVKVGPKLAEVLTCLQTTLQVSGTIIFYLY